MPSTDLDICNQALANVGVSRQISAVAENSKEAALCRLWLATTKEQVLSEFPWPFADTYATLGQVATAPNGDWGYSYRYPSDCIRIQRVVGAGRTVESPPFKIGSDTAGLLVYTDENPATVLYTRRILDAGFYPVDVAQAISWRLGYNLAKPMATSSSTKGECWNGYLQVIEMARALAGNEASKDPEPESTFITARE